MKKREIKMFFIEEEILYKIAFDEKEIKKDPVAYHPEWYDPW